MTRDELDRLSPGRELDALVATHLMGWRVERDPQLPECHWKWYKPDGQLTYVLPLFSTSIAAAWRVVERMTQDPPTREEAIAAYNVKFADWFRDADLWIFRQAEAAHAICRAALFIRAGERP